MLCKGRKRGRGITREEAEKYAENMTYREAIYNLEQAKSVPYRKATFIKVNELLDELEQEPRKGKWTKLSDTVPCMNCPICGSIFTLILGGDKMHYCPNCGADMREVKE